MPSGAKYHSRFLGKCKFDRVRLIKFTVYGLVDFSYLNRMMNYRLFLFILQKVSFLFCELSFKFDDLLVFLSHFCCKSCVEFSISQISLDAIYQCLYKFLRIFCYFAYSF